MSDDYRGRLVELLEVAVPLWQWHHRNLSWDERMERVRAAEEVLASPGAGETLATGTRCGKPGVAAAAFNALAQAISILSFCPGGVTAFGRVWRADERSGV